jgi:ferric-dicitrate binding protein FerR (iron transport regulator)
MQTIYATTTHFIRHEGNMVDLTEYRRKLALAQGQPTTMEDPAQEERPHRAPRRRGVEWTGMALDCAASIALIVAALSFAAKIL